MCPRAKVMSGNWGVCELPVGFRIICRQKGAVTITERLSPILNMRGLIRLLAIPAVVALGLMAAHLVAQMEGDRGVPPIASSGDFEVGGIHVDVYAGSADAARTAGWLPRKRKRPGCFPPPSTTRGTPREMPGPAADTQEELANKIRRIEGGTQPSWRSGLEVAGRALKSAAGSGCFTVGLLP